MNKNLVRTNEIYMLQIQSQKIVKIVDVLKINISFALIYN